MAHVRFKLMKVLVGDSKADPILAELREHVGDGERREILKLVNIDEKVSPLIRRQLRPTKSSQSKRGDQQTPRSEELSSPIRPLAKFTSSTLPSSIT